MSRLTCQLGFVLTAALLASTSIDAAPSVVGYELVSSARVSRTVFEYTYRLKLQNDSLARTSVIGILATTSFSTLIVDGTVNFGTLAADAVVSSTDTFTIRQDRLQPFDATTLVWSVQSVPLTLKWDSENWNSAVWQ